MGSASSALRRKPWNPKRVECRPKYPRREWTGTARAHPNWNTAPISQQASAKRCDRVIDSENRLFFNCAVSFVFVWNTYTLDSWLYNLISWPSCKGIIFLLCVSGVHPTDSCLCLNVWHFSDTWEIEKRESSYVCMDLLWLTILFLHWRFTIPSNFGELFVV